MLNAIVNGEWIQSIHVAAAQLLMSVVEHLWQEDLLRQNKYSCKYPPSAQNSMNERGHLSLHTAIKDKINLRGHPSVALKTVSYQHIHKVTFGSCFFCFFFLTWQFHAINRTRAWLYTFNYDISHMIFEAWWTRLTVHIQRFHTHQTQTWPQGYQSDPTLSSEKRALLLFSDQYVLKSGVSLLPTVCTWW